MSIPVAININNNAKQMYFLAEDLKNYDSDFFVDTSKTIRKIIEKKNIPVEDTLYANKLKNVWNICDDTCRKAKLFLTQT